jgi:SET domain-containing protein
MFLINHSLKSILKKAHYLHKNTVHNYSTFVKVFTSNKIYIDNSKIENAGRGVFAAVNIKKGELIEECPIIEVPLQDVSNLKESILINYYFYWGPKNKKLAVALGFGSIYNHSYEPNATYKRDNKRSIISFFAIKNIKKNEEITSNYNFGNPDDKSPVTVKDVPVHENDLVDWGRIESNSKKLQAFSGKSKLSTVEILEHDRQRH